MEKSTGLNRGQMGAKPEGAPQGPAAKRVLTAEGWKRRQRRQGPLSSAQPES